MDCHCHLYQPLFQNINDIIKGCQSLKAIVVVAEAEEDWPLILKNSNEYPLLKPCLGIHPEKVTSDYQNQLDALSLALRQHHAGLWALGEVGLDFTPKVLLSNSKQQQLADFSKQIELAKLYDLPLNVHSRSAGHYAIEKLIRFGTQRAMLHAFDGKLKYARIGEENGFYFSVPPSTVRDEGMKKIVHSLQVDSLLLESDSPALAPIKGELNYPWNISVSAEVIANIKKISVEEVYENTTSNALKLFNKHV